MKKPRVSDFDPTAKPAPLATPMDDLPTIEPPAKASGSAVAMTAPLPLQGGKQVGREASREGGLEPSRTPVRFDINVTAYRKLSFNFTNEESYGLEDVKTDVERRQGMACSKQDLVRVAIHQLIEDYRDQQERSFAVRRLRLKKA